MVYKLKIIIFMKNASLYKLGFLSAIFSGATIISGKILAISSFYLAGEFLDFLSPLFGLYAITTIYLWQRQAIGITGCISFIVLYTGISMVLCLDYFGAFILPYLPEGTIDQLLNGPTATALSVSGSVFISGIILFGITTLRAGLIPAGATLLFIFGFIPVPLGELLPVEVVYFGSVVAGSGLLWWGIYLYRYQVRVVNQESETPTGPEFRRM